VLNYDYATFSDWEWLTNYLCKIIISKKLKSIISKIESLINTYFSLKILIFFLFDTILKLIYKNFYYKVKKLLNNYIFYFLNNNKYFLSILNFYFLYYFILLISNKYN